MPRFDLEDTYLGVDGQGEVTRMPVDADFWRTMDSNPAMRANLVSVFAGAGDWTNWEMHPHGDEVLVVLEGSGVLVFERPEGDERLPVRAGRTVIVPAGVWHRAVDQVGLKMLFITYGAGTQHKPVAG